MDNTKTVVIAIVAVILLVLLYSATMKVIAINARKKKEKYGGANFGWVESDFNGGPRFDSHAQPTSCSQQASCNAKCNVAPEGMTRSQCMTHCQLYGPGISGNRCTSAGCN